jgi:hypothetical protein
MLGVIIGLVGSVKWYFYTIDLSNCLSGILGTVSRKGSGFLLERIC